MKEKIFYLDDDDPKNNVGETTEYKDIVSVTIILQLWHITDNIFKNLDAVSLLQCEKVSHHHHLDKINKSMLGL